PPPRARRKRGGGPPARRPPARERMVRRAPLLPALIFLIVVTQIPFLVTLVISSLSWNVLRPGERQFTGLQNYLTVFTDERLRAALITTIVITSSVVIVSVLFGLALA